MEAPVKRERATATAGLVGIGLVALVFWDAPWMWPLKILVVLFHELGHAVAAIATGGEVVSIELSPQQGGLAQTRGGLRFFVLSAGYLGSIAFGALWLFLGRTERTARVGIWVMASVLLVCTALWVRPVFSFGFGFCLVATLGVLAVARLAPQVVSQWMLRAIGVFSVLYAVWDIRSDVFERSTMESDATMLAEITFIPGPVWGVVWLGVGLTTLFALRKWLV